MENIFLDDSINSGFTWKKLGDIVTGRGELGTEMPVLIYRLMQYTLMDVMSRDIGEDAANEYFRKAGYLAGGEYAKNSLDLSVDFEIFMSALQKSLRKLKVGILRIEEYNAGSGELILTVGEDLDCSGLPITGKNVCVWDEGFLAGILNAYTGKNYVVKETHCWASGSRVCRFCGTVNK